MVASTQSNDCSKVQQESMYRVGLSIWNDQMPQILIQFTHAFSGKHWEKKKSWGLWETRQQANSTTKKTNQQVSAISFVHAVFI